MPYHDFPWYYGPLSLLWNGLLFKWFGPGIMILAASNLAVYAAIVTLAYLAFRSAWGKLAAFAALAVFVSVFSFSLLNAVGNYNYVLPYSNEATHGILLALVTAFAMVRWCDGPSRAGAFCLGLCGGLAAVLKPEIMFATGALGAAALMLRYWQRRPIRPAEYGLLVAGVALPTLLIAAVLARHEPWPTAIVDTSHGWLAVFQTHYQEHGMDESSYMGFDNAGRNFTWELTFAFCAVLIIGAAWAAGWFVNRPWRPALRLLLALAAGYLACSVSLGGGFEIGPCLPGLIAIVFVILVVRLVRLMRRDGRLESRDVMALALVLLAGTLLARMALRARINHFGFVQAALAGMVAAAFLVAEVPRWTGRGRWGRRVTLAGCIAMLIAGCASVVAETMRNHALQTQPVASGGDLFYAFHTPDDQTGAVVNWSVEQLRAAPPEATLLVLPEGVMINYLSRRARPLPDFTGDEPGYIKQLEQARPDYVIIIVGDQRDAGIPRFGAPGQPGEKIRQWLQAHYVTEASHREEKKWAFIMRRESAH